MYIINHGKVFSNHNANRSVAGRGRGNERDGRRSRGIKKSRRKVRKDNKNKKQQQQDQQDQQEQQDQQDQQSYRISNNNNNNINTTHNNNQILIFVVVLFGTILTMFLIYTIYCNTYVYMCSLSYVVSRNLYWGRSLLEFYLQAKYTMICHFMFFCLCTFYEKIM